MRKIITLGIMLLFLGMTISSSTGIIVSNDDTTPPVTTIEFYPDEPTGENGWYVSDIEVTLSATDDLSGISVIYYCIDSGEWKNHNGEFLTFMMDEDGEHVIEYYSVDNAGNEEDLKSAELKMDQTSPEIDDVTRAKIGKNKIKFTVDVFDATSGVDRVEFYINDELMFTDYEYPYEWIWNSTEGTGITRIEGSTRGDFNYDFLVYDRAGNVGLYYLSSPTAFVEGIICDVEVTEQSVSFFAVIVWYTNYPIPWMPEYHIRIFKRLTFPNDCEGYIGRYFIRATFYNG